MLLSALLVLLMPLTFAYSFGLEYYEFNLCDSNMVLKPQNRYKEVSAGSPLHCGLLCGSEAACMSFDYYADQGQCHLGSVAVSPTCQEMVHHSGQAQHYAEGPECSQGKELQLDRTCECPNAFGGAGCGVLMQDCADWDRYTENSGIQWIWPQTSAASFQVYCDKMKSNPRTMLMRHSQGDVSFYRGWVEYSTGFGHLSEDHWLGLQYMHLLTLNRPYTLRFSIKLGNASDDDEVSYITHSDFHIGNESSGYSMSTTAMTSSNTTADDCLYPDLIHIPFSTYDVNDLDENCSLVYGGGWWFNGTAGCALCNPTGRLLLPVDGKRSGAGDEVFWTNSLGDVVPTSILMFLQPQ